MMSLAIEILNKKKEYSLAMEKVLGNSLKRLDTPNLISIFAGKPSAAP
jgi:hypothetical protein